MTKLRIKGHKLITSWSGVAGTFANGRCECGWHYQAWTERMRAVRISHQNHLRRVAAEQSEIDRADREDAGMSALAE